MTLYVEVNKFIHRSTGDIVYITTSNTEEILEYTRNPLYTTGGKVRITPKQLEDNERGNDNAKK